MDVRLITLLRDALNSYLEGDQGETSAQEPKKKRGRPKKTQEEPKDETAEIPFDEENIEDALDTDDDSSDLLEEDETPTVAKKTFEERRATAVAHVKKQIEDGDVDPREFLEEHLFKKGVFDKINLDKWDIYKDIKRRYDDNDDNRAYALFVTMLTDDTGEIKDFHIPYLVTPVGSEKPTPFCNGVPMIPRDDLDSKKLEHETKVAEDIVGGNLFALTLKDGELLFRKLKNGNGEEPKKKRGRPKKNKD